MTRDRGGAHSLAAIRALAHAMQVSERWRLMENARHQAFQAATRSCMRQIRAGLGVTPADPGLLTAAEKLQYEGDLRREDVDAAAQQLPNAGVTIKEIVRRTGHSRGLVKLAAISSVGVINATALLAAVGDDFALSKAPPSQRHRLSALS